MTSQNQTRQLVVAVWCGLHCSEEHETSWKHAELGWESKDFLRQQPFSWGLKHVWNGRTKTIQIEECVQRLEEKMEHGHDRNWKKPVHVAYIV